jgi:lysosomal acid lipase/cholesteryl ester hydrolase
MAFRQISEHEMKLRFVVTLIALLAPVYVRSQLLQKSDRILELIKHAGYKGEAHKVVTEDGYFLKVHRVCARLTRAQDIVRKPVFLMHGIVATSADFLITGRDIALAYLLSDQGYDVWLGNSRGNPFSSKHERYSKLSREFWSFSWHEIGFYDLPAMIDYMLNVTESKSAFYAAHSQGTTALLVLLSTRPEYNAKLDQVHLMGSSAFRKKRPDFMLIDFILTYLVSSQTKTTTRTQK